MTKFEVSTSRLNIRKLKLTDLSKFYEYRSNPDVTKFQSFDVITISEAEEIIKNQLDIEFGEPGEWAQYGIENKGTMSIIGDCAIKLDQNDLRIAEIGLTISHHEQKKGFAKEALSGILHYLFDIKKIHRVVEIMAADNIAAIQLVESLGFRKEGHFIKNIFFKGKWVDEFQYAMLKREWHEIQESKK